MEKTKNLLSTFFGNGRWRVILLCLSLLLWAGFELSRGHRVYAFTITMVFFLSFFIKNSSYSLLSILVIILLLTQTNIFSLQDHLRTQNMNFFLHPKQALNNLFTLDSGRKVYADYEKGEDMAMVELIDRSGLTSYRLSEGILNDNVINTRLTEIAWLKNYDESSPFVFCKVNEIPLYSDCEITINGEEVALAYCN